ncbi:MAG: ComEA family DNA-binding protein [Myxococcota bacterium]
MKNLNKLGWVAVVVLAVSSSAALAAKSKTKTEVTGVVNLNTATAQQLDLLPGIGAKAARRIIEFRAKTPFAKVEDLRKVKGFGPKKLEKLKPFLSVSGPTTVSVKKVKLDEKPTAEAAAASPKSPAPAAQGRKGAGRQR